jgi:hypothetical protein
MSTQYLSNQTVNRRYLVERISISLALAGFPVAAAGCVEPDAMELEEASLTAPDGGAVSTFAEMGCVPTLLPPLPQGSVYPWRMWSNGRYFASHVGVGPAAVGYSQVLIEYSSFGTPVVLSTSISNGEFSLYTLQGPANGTTIAARFSGPERQTVGCRFKFRYNGGGVYSFDEMGCVVTPVPD